MVHRVPRLKHHDRWFSTPPRGGHFCDPGQQCRARRATETPALTLGSKAARRQHECQGQEVLDLIESVLTSGPELLRRTFAGSVLQGSEREKARSHLEGPLEIPREIPREILTNGSWDSGFNNRFESASTTTLGCFDNPLC